MPLLYLLRRFFEAGFGGGSFARTGPGRPFFSAQATCDYQSELGSPYENYGYGVSGGIASGIAAGIRKADLMQLCMKAAGWHLEKVPTAAETKKSEWATGYSFGLDGGVCVTWSTDDWMRGCTAGLAAKVTAAK